MDGVAEQLGGTGLGDQTRAEDLSIVSMIVLSQLETACLILVQTILSSYGR